MVRRTGLEVSLLARWWRLVKRMWHGFCLDLLTVSNNNPLTAFPLCKVVGIKIVVAFIN